MRQVNGWGFKRIVSGNDHNSYYHELFIRDLPQLCLKMKRIKKGDIEKSKKGDDEDGDDLEGREDEQDEGTEESAPAPSSFDGMLGSGGSGGMGGPAPTHLMPNNAQSGVLQSLQGAGMPGPQQMGLLNAATLAGLGGGAGPSATMSAGMNLPPGMMRPPGLPNMMGQGMGGPPPTGPPGPLPGAPSSLPNFGTGGPDVPSMGMANPPSDPNAPTPATTAAPPPSLQGVDSAMLAKLQEALAAAGGGGGANPMMGQPTGSQPMPSPGLQGMSNLGFLNAQMGSGGPSATLLAQLQAASQPPGPPQAASAPVTEEKDGGEDADDLDGDDSGGEDDSGGSDE